MASKEYKVRFDLSKPIRLWPLPVALFTLRVNKGRRKLCICFIWNGEAKYWWA